MFYLGLDTIDDFRLIGIFPHILIAFMLECYQENLAMLFLNPVL